MKTTVPLFLVIIALAAACNSKLNHRTETEEPPLTYDTAKTAIIPWDSAKYKFRNSDFKPGELTQQDLELADSLFSACVNNYNREMNLPKEHKVYEIDLSLNYKRQLVTVINSKGEKEVWINCFCRDRGNSWKTSILSVHDGGPCYFNLMINLTTKTCYELMVNGFA